MLFDFDQQMLFLFEYQFKHLINFLLSLDVAFYFSLCRNFRQSNLLIFSFIASVVCDKLRTALSILKIMNTIYHPFLWYFYGFRFLHQKHLFIWILVSHKQYVVPLFYFLKKTNHLLQHYRVNSSSSHTVLKCHFHHFQNSSVNFELFLFFILSFIDQPKYLGPRQFQKYLTAIWYRY